jgi:hypothetical protein
VTDSLSSLDEFIVGFVAPMFFVDGPYELVIVNVDSDGALMVPEPYAS